MPSLHDFLQLTANGLVTGSGYALLGAGFALIYSVTERFHFAYGLSLTIGAYAAARLGAELDFSFWAAVAGGALFALVSGVLIEGLLYRPMAARAGRSALLTIFVASLGLTIIGENLIKLLWLEQAGQSIHGVTLKAVKLGSIHLTALDLQEMAVAWILIALLALVLSRSGLGRQIRAVRASTQMSLTVGISPPRIFLLVFAIGSAMAGVAGVFLAAQTSATPSMGYEPTLLAFVVAFMAGVERSPFVVGLVGIALGLVASWSGLWLSAQWSTPIVFGVVVLYAAVRSVELRGRFRRPLAAAS
ncbi:MAG TPA: branched-chain amino acid ABC transporter permease [Solirubrobacterales bacterium]|jgi:branched-chain amino acid transport system permease protein